jgi:DNA-binding MarR family transcriptional regulator
MSTPNATGRSWLTTLKELLVQRMRRLLVVSGIFALSFMMVVPVLAAETMPDEGHGDVLDGDALVVFHRSDDLEVDTTSTGTGLLLAPLYLRIPEPDVLNCTLRSDIRSIVSERPGATFTEIREAVGAATGTVQHHLRVLVRGGVLRRVRTGKYTRYYPANSRVLALSPSEEAVVNHLDREGPSTKAELANRLGMSRQLVHYHVERMEGKGLVQVDRDGPAPVVHLNLTIPRGPTPPLDGRTT